MCRRLNENSDSDYLLKSVLCQYTDCIVHTYQKLRTNLIMITDVDRCLEKHLWRVRVEDFNLIFTFAIKKLQFF